jgi:hypothetical protein
MINFFNLFLGGLPDVRHLCCGYNNNIISNNSFIALFGPKFSGDNHFY